MDLKQIWLDHFRTVVEAEAQRHGNKLPAAYRAIEEKTGIAYDYIYQIYNGQPKRAPKSPTIEVMQKIESAYAAGRSPGWVSQPLDKTAYVNVTLNNEYKPTEEALRVAKLFDMIPEDDLIRRSMAYSAATTAIIGVIQGHTK